MSSDKIQPRDMDERLARIAAESNVDAPMARRILDAAAKIDAAAKGRRAPFARLDPQLIFADPPAPRWVCEPLGWCPGRPAMIAGYGFSGKTIAAQCAALQIAAGRSIWANSSETHDRGGFPLTPGEHGKARRVLHLDYEMGRDATLRRYAKLARGLALRADDIGGRLDVVCLPPVFLNEPDRPAIEAFFATECAARAGEDPPVVVVDAFRGAIPGEDENDSNVRCFLDIFLRVSERTGATFVVLHHAGKSDRTDARMVLRGSSAIFDACGSVLGIAPVDANDLAGPKSVSHLKNPEGRPCENFGLAVVDTRDAQGRTGLAVQHRTREQIAPAMPERDAPPKDTKKSSGYTPRGGLIT